MDTHSLRVINTPPRPRGLRLPPRLEAASARLSRDLETGGPIRAELRRLARHGTRDGETGVRTVVEQRRRRRSERVAHVGVVLQIFVRLTDLASGRIGRPAARGWHYLPTAVLDGYAFGEIVPGARSQARTDRAMRDLEAAGWIRVIERPRRDSTGAWSARTAVRVLTQKALQILGIRLTGAAADEQIAAHQVGERLARVASLRRRPGRRSRPEASPAAASVPATVAPMPRGPPTEIGRAAIAELAALLGLRR